MKIYSILITTLLFSCSEQPESGMDNYSETLLLIEAGWLPSWINSSVSSVNEKHDIDTNEVIAKFLMEERDWPPQGCLRSKFIPKKPRLNAKWWKLDEDEAKNDFVYYRCLGGSFFSFDKEASLFYYWSTDG